jgi:ankyrin repeat protein
VSTPRRSLPEHPDLEQQKKLAKELLRAVRAGDAEAVARVRAVLPDKPDIGLAEAQHVLAREYGFASWAKLRAHIRAQAVATAPARERLRALLQKGDAREVRRVLRREAELRALVNEPIFSFDSPALVHVAGRADVAMVDALLEAGADPDRRSDWWAGGFHALHSAGPAVAERLIAAGATVDACAAAHLDRPDLLARVLDADPARVHERGGDGQTPLHFARSRAVADLLLERGADIDARDVDHRATPAQWMLDHRRGAGRFELAAYLVERGAAADIFLAAALGLTDRVRAMIEADPSLLDLRTSQGEYGEQPPSSLHIYTWTIGTNLSPLQVAAQFDQRATVEVLRALASPRQRFLAACAQTDAEEARRILRERPGLVAELSAEEQRVLPDAGWNGDAAPVALMLELGFDPRTPGQDRGTVLHCAAWQGVPDCVAVVLRHPGGRALIEERDPTHGGKPLGWCCHGSLHCGDPRSDHAAVARMLLDAGARPDNGPVDATPPVRAVIDAWRRR